ncbi:PREDICTED: protein FAM177A1-like [Nicrophorus vespilloides]|uniref:Protein FAM177A1-like n=1 Tax=Nicrophorus vespilloides TaxID=110193 RepID=A0ABM1MLR3_NICVS|nr:PREDICTED: protein FAM177A1-like [Nicrophorus vespilloides]
MERLQKAAIPQQEKKYKSLDGSDHKQKKDIAVARNFRNVKVLCIAMETQTPAAESAVQVKEPKRVLHCGDGVLEEFSDEEDGVAITPSTYAASESALQDPKTMTWGPWMVNRVTTAGSTALAACDYLGESLASFFGITTPKYQYEIEEYKKIEKEKKEYEEQKRGWMPMEGAEDTAGRTVDEQPFSSAPATAPTPV